MSELQGKLTHDVEALATEAGREIDTSGHEQARRYLEGRLAELGLEAYTGESFALPYSSRGVDFTNLVAIAPGQDRDLPPLLIGAHYDTADALPGADDNAAADAIVLALAEQLLAAPMQRDVIIALFDAEEPPYYLTHAMGSTRFYEDQRKGDIHAALILDLVGHDVPLPDLADLLFITGMESSPCLEAAIHKVSNPEGIRLVTALNRYVGDVSDHHAFRLGGTPYLFFSCGRWEHYHMPTDTPDKLNYGKMAAITVLLENLLRELAGYARFVPEEYDTTETDLAFMQSSLSPLAGKMGIELESREDIDKFAGMLNSLLGI